MYRSTGLILMAILISLPFIGCGGKEDARTAPDGGNRFIDSLDGRGRLLTPSGDSAGLVALSAADGFDAAEFDEVADALNMTIKQAKGAYRVTIEAPGGAPLRADLLLHFDPDRLTPVESLFDPAFTAGHLALAVPDIKGTIPLAFHRLEGADHAGTIFEAYFEPGRDESRTLYQFHPPLNAPQPFGGYESSEAHVLFWVGHNPGDYSRDGTVNGQDLFPLALHFNEESNFNGHLATQDGNDCIDGNQDGVINGMDLFVISVNFNSRIEGYNVYKSFNDGADWELTGDSPVARDEPASFNCTDVGIYADEEDFFEAPWYHVTATAEQEESASSETLTDEEQEIITMSAPLTGNDQVVTDPFGVTVSIPAGAASIGDSVVIGLISNPGGSGGVPLVGRTIFVEFDVAGGLSDDYIVRMPFLPRDFFSIESGDLGLLTASEAKSISGWQALDPGDYEINDTGEDEGYAEYATDSGRIILSLYKGGELDAAIMGRPTMGDPPLDVRFSCAVRGGTFPYTYTWMVDGVPEEPSASHRFQRTFDEGNYLISCEVRDNLGDTVEADPFRISVGNPWSISDAYQQEIGTLTQYAPLALYQGDNPMFIVLDVLGVMHVGWHDGALWDEETVDLPDSPMFYYSLQVDSAENPVLTWYEPTDDDLYYTQWTGAAWDSEVVADSGDPGRGTVMILDGFDQPITAYTNDAGPDMVVARYVTDSWVFDTVESSTGYGSGQPGLALDPDDGNPAICWFSTVGGNALKFAKFNGIGWDTETVVTGDPAGGSCALAFDDDGNPSIAWQDFANSELKFSWHNGGIWQTDSVYAGNVAGISLGFDIEDRPLISFNETTDQSLMACWFTGAAWDPYVIDDVSTVDSRTSLVFDSTGNPLISYIDSDTWTVKIASGLPYPNTAPDTTPPAWDGAFGAQFADPRDGAAWIHFGTAIDADSPPVKYNVYVSTTTPIDFDTATKWPNVATFASTLTDRKAQIPGLTNGVRYYFAVRAEDSASTPNEETNNGEQSCTPWAPNYAWVEQTVGGSFPDGSGTSLVFDTGGNAHLSFHAPALYYARRDGATGLWSAPEQVDAAATSHGSIAVDSEFNPHISYWEDDSDVVKHAKKDGTWSFDEVDAPLWDNIGTTSIAIDADDNIFISYVDPADASLNIGWFESDPQEWNTAVIDDGAGNDVGRFNALTLTQGSTARDLQVVYYDISDGRLRYAESDFGGGGFTWSYGNIHGQIGVDDIGPWCDVAANNAGKLGASYQDADNGWLQYATWDDGWVLTEAVDSSPDSTGLYTSTFIDPFGAGHPFIAYYNETDRDLWIATKVFPGDHSVIEDYWDIRPVEVGANDIGKFASIAATPGGQIGIATINETSDEITFFLGGNPFE